MVVGRALAQWLPPRSRLRGAHAATARNTQSASIGGQRDKGREEARRFASVDNLPSLAAVLCVL